MQSTQEGYFADRCVHPAPTQAVLRARGREVSGKLRALREEQGLYVGFAIAAAVLFALLLFLLGWSRSPDVPFLLIVLGASALYFTVHAFALRPELAAAESEFREVARQWFVLWLREELDKAREVERRFLRRYSSGGSRG